MHLGYNTNGFASHSLEDAIEVIAELGYQSIGITVDHHALDPRQSNHLDEVAARRRQLQKLGLYPVIETGARFLLDPRRKHQPTLLSADPDERKVRREFLLHSFELARWLKAPVVSMWSGSPVDDTRSQDELDEVLVAELQLLCDRADDNGVWLAFEPEPGMHIETMADFDRISSALGREAFQLTLDLGHAHLTETSVLETIEAYHSRIANVHVEGMRRPHHDHLVPWDSEYDVREALQRLESLGYDGPATLELSRSSHNAVEIARRSMAFLRGDTFN